ncbi:polysaccharide biosynthesis protein [Paenibacillus sp. J5C_2022]|uniref:polysaccharide biosynthesis protein n=1 Tax=Paenibacillus sp. J5C2022 TaxID=2977129 RepID=UPI0021CE57BD|nr:polysaccharide biosynthesis protein [Paenibacillus sp. J5C2022]MCU6710421.1 polysaccharide biosynthesis protein [Paenibacillus sp. J5C2022]
MFKNSIILITGGTGSWGQVLTRKLLMEKPKEVRILSRGEFSQVQMARDFDHDPALKFLIGDVRDYDAVWRACEGVDYVFHLAALKHVPICEHQPEEALKTNVAGTDNVIRASLDRGVKKVMDVSTDKAVNPVNFYGMTKLLGERLMLIADERSTTTRFICIRGGNVLGTRGSVVPFFRDRIRSGQTIPITSFDMTRFLLTVNEAIELLHKAATEAIGGEIYVMRMPACNIRDLAATMQAHYDAGHLKLEEVGIRPGEKLHEELLSAHEASRARIFSNRYYVILPMHPGDEHLHKYKGLPKVNFTSYNSATGHMSKEEIDQMLAKGGFYQ